MEGSMKLSPVGFQFQVLNIENSIFSFELVEKSNYSPFSQQMRPNKEGNRSSC